MQSVRKCHCTLLPICFDIHLQLYFLKKMLTYAIFNKCWVTAPLPQRRFTHIRALTNKKHSFCQASEKQTRNRDIIKALRDFLTHKAIRILYSLLSKSFSITSEMRFEKSTALFEVITGFPVLSSISFRAFPATSPPSFATLLFSEKD